MVVAISDQRPALGNAKYWVKFLKRKTWAQIGPQRLANHSDCTVLFLECVKKARFHYEYTFHPLPKRVPDTTNGVLMY